MNFRSHTASPPLSVPHREILLETAADSIDYGIHRGEPFPVIPAQFPEPLREIRSCFVTLRKKGELRGCIGSLEARLPLIQDVAEHAFQAAFHDPRFSAITAEELHDLQVSISVLGRPEPMTVADEQDLLNQLKPGTDGLVLEDGHHRATFLPAVWESLPNPIDFLAALKQKAGLSADHWSSTTQTYRYTTEHIP